MFKNDDEKENAHLDDARVLRATYLETDTYDIISHDDDGAWREGGSIGEGGGTKRHKGRAGQARRQRRKDNARYILKKSGMLYMYNHTKMHTRSFVRKIILSRGPRRREEAQKL